MRNIKKMTATALFVSFGIVLPLAFHSIPNAGVVFLPMHIPVLICGILCGFPYGLVCGLVTPLLSALLTGMPPMIMLPSMLSELATYGLITSLLMRYVRINNPYIKLYCALTGAMLSGRLVYGILNAAIFRAGSYSLEMWMSAALFTAIPGIAMQIVFVPAAVIALQKANLLEPRLQFESK